MRTYRPLVVVVSISLLILVAILAVFLFGFSKPGWVTDDTADLRVRKVVGGLEHPWGISFLPNGNALFTERGGTLSVVNGGTANRIATVDDVEAGGEGGLMGIAVDPEYASNRSVYVCHNRSNDIVVKRLVLNSAASGLERSQVIIDDLPSSTSGRHSGCQLGFGPDGNLWIGTGDAADESTPQDRSSLGGKILRVTRDGMPASGNPDGPDKRVYSYGHRNTQGLAFFTKAMNGSFGVSTEHGPDRDDEVNALVPGNFGWSPGSGYDESVPMTDSNRFPETIEALWSSGGTTIATSGATFVRGDSWGTLNGWLAVGVQKEQHIRFLEFDENGQRGNDQKTLFEGEYGRIRAVVMGSDQSLFFSTDNGSNDAIYVISPTR